MTASPLPTSGKLTPAQVRELLQAPPLWRRRDVQRSAAIALLSTAATVAGWDRSPDLAKQIGNVLVGMMPTAQELAVGRGLLPIAGSVPQIAGQVADDVIVRLLAEHDQAQAAARDRG